MSAFDKLSPKQSKFVRHYYLNGHGTKAAIHAGYSKDSAYSIASENLRKPEIIAAMGELEEETRQKYKALEHRIVQELSAIAFFDLTECMELTDNGAVRFKKNFKELPLRVRRGLNSYNQTFSQFGDSTTFRSHDKLRAIDMLGKHIGMFKEGPNVPNGSGDSDNNETPLQQIQRIIRERAVGKGSEGSDSSEGSK